MDLEKSQEKVRKNQTFDPDTDELKNRIKKRENEKKEIIFKINDKKEKSQEREKSIIQITTELEGIDQSIVSLETENQKLNEILLTNEKTLEFELKNLSDGKHIKTRLESEHENLSLMIAKGGTRLNKIGKLTSSLKGEVESYQEKIKELLSEKEELLYLESQVDGEKNKNLFKESKNKKREMELLIEEVSRLRIFNRKNEKIRKDQEEKRFELAKTVFAKKNELNQLIQNNSKLSIKIENNESIIADALKVNEELTFKKAQEREKIDLAINKKNEIAKTVEEITKLSQEKKIELEQLVDKTNCCEEDNLKSKNSYIELKESLNILQEEMFKKQLNLEHKNNVFQDLKIKKEAITPYLEDAKNILAGLEIELAQKFQAISEKNSELKNIKEESKILSDKLNLNNKEVTREVNEGSIIQNKIEKEKEMIVQKQEQLDSEEKKILQLILNNKNMEKDCNQKQEEIEDLEVQIQFLDHRCSNGTVESDLLKKTYNSLIENLNAKSEKLNIKREEVKNFEQQINHDQRNCAELEKKIRTTEDESIKMKEDLQNKADTLQFERERMGQLGEVLKDNKNKMVVIESKILSKSEELKSVIDRTKELENICDSFNTKIIDNKNEMDRVEKELSLNQKDIKEQGFKIRQYEEQIKFNCSKIQNINKENIELEEIKKQNKTKIDDLENHGLELTNNIHQKIIEKEKLKQENSSIENILEIKNNDLEELDQKYCVLTNKAVALQESILNKKNEAEKLNRLHLEKEKRLEEKSQEYKKFSQDCRAYDEIINTIKNETTELNLKMAEKIEELGKVETRCTDLTSELDFLEKNLKKQREEFEKEERELSLGQEKVSIQGSKLKTLKQTCHSEREKLQKTLQFKFELEKEKCDLQKKKEFFKDEIEDLSCKRSKKETELSKLKQIVLELKNDLGPKRDAFNEKKEVIQKFDLQIVEFTIKQKELKNELDKLNISLEVNKRDIKNKSFEWAKNLNNLEISKKEIRVKTENISISNQKLSIKIKENEKVKSLYQELKKELNHLDKNIIEQNKKINHEDDKLILEQKRIVKNKEKIICINEELELITVKIKNIAQEKQTLEDDNSGLKAQILEMEDKVKGLEVDLIDALRIRNKLIGTRNTFIKGQKVIEDELNHREAEVSMAKRQMAEIQMLCLKLESDLDYKKVKFNTLKKNYIEFNLKIRDRKKNKKRNEKAMRGFTTKIKYTLREFQKRRAQTKAIQGEINNLEFIVVEKQREHSRLQNTNLIAQKKGFELDKKREDLRKTLSEITKENRFNEYINKDLEKMLLGLSERLQNEENLLKEASLSISKTHTLNNELKKL